MRSLRALWCRVVGHRIVERYWSNAMGRGVRRECARCGRFHSAHTVGSWGESIQTSEHAEHWLAGVARVPLDVEP